MVSYATLSFTTMHVLAADDPKWQPLMCKEVASSYPFQHPERGLKWQSSNPHLNFINKIVHGSVRFLFFPLSVHESIQLSIYLFVRLRNVVNQIGKPYIMYLRLFTWAIKTVCSHIILINFNQYHVFK